MFSLLWSEHCAYKHSKKLLRTLPDRGPAARHGAGRERGRGRRRRRAGGRVQGRVAQPPERRRAVPGRGHRRRRDPARHLRDRRAADRGARLAALRRADLASARATCSTARSPASATTATPSACPTIGGEVYFEAPVRDELPRQRDGARPGARPRSSSAPRPPASATSLILFGASTGRDGIGGASVLASAELGEADDDKRPTRPGRRPVRGEQADRVLARAARAGAARLAAGPRRRGPDVERRRRWRPRARSGSTSTSRSVPLREADMEPFEIMVSESQERMLCVAEPARVDEVLARLREVGGPRHRDRRGHRHAPHADPAAATSVVGDMPVDALVDDCPLYDLEPAKPARAAVPARRRDARGRTRTSRDDAARAAGVAEHRLAPPAVRAVRLHRRLAHGAPPRAGRRRRARAAGGGAIARVDRRQRPPRRGRPLPRARSRRCSSARRTSPASAPSRSGLTNCLNFGNPEKPHIAWQLTEAVRGLGDACRALDVPVVGGNVSLYNEGAERPDLPDAGRRHGRRAARPAPRRPASASRARATRSRSSAASARRRWPAPSWPSCAASRCPTGCRRSTSTPCARTHDGDPRRRPRRRAVAARHDVAEGGFAVALAECCLAGGIGASSTSARDDGWPTCSARARRLRGLRAREALERSQQLAPACSAASAATRSIASASASAGRWPSCATAHGALAPLFP